MYSITLNFYKYGSLNTSDVEEFKTEQLMVVRLKEIKQWINSKYDDKWFMKATGSNGQIVSGKVDL